MMRRRSLIALVAGGVVIASGLAGAVVAPVAHATTQTYTYVGAPQIYVVPDGVTSIDVTLEGAQGLNVSGGGTGGEGATVTATISVSPGEVLQINVGGQGVSNAGAFNGGGRPGGGGASDIRRPDFATTMTTFTSCAYNFSCSYSQRIVIAGGGGGGGNLAGSNGGRGGQNGEAGAAGNGAGGDATGGAGGTQVGGGSAGGGSVTGASSAPGAGSLGVGGANGWATGAFGGGGGGGYYGGGQGGQSSNGAGGNLGAGGGGGGSSWAGGAGVSSGVLSTGGGTGHGSVVVSIATAISNASFGYTGTAQTYTVDSGVTELAVRLNAGKGAAQGDIVYGRLPVSGGDVLQVNIGGASVPVSYFNGAWSGGSGGWNGGGNATATTTDGATGGGGASDLRIAPYGLAQRVVVAGGGAGCNSWFCPGNGWTVGGGGQLTDGTGGNSYRNGWEPVYTGGGLTAGGIWLTSLSSGTPDGTMPSAAGGAFGVGGEGGSGGGGGYFGGAGGSAGGGGSSYATVTGPDAAMQGAGNVLGVTGAAFQHDGGGSSGDGIAVLTAMPSASTDAASGVTATSVAVSGTVRPRFLASKPAVYYSTSQTTVDNGGGSVAYLTGPASASILAGDSTQAVSGSLSSLSRGTTYYFRVCARSVAGNGCGQTRSFTTDPRLTYDANSPSTGSAPAVVDAAAGTVLTVAANTGSLTQSGSLFNGWNTLSNGTGTTYMPGASLTLNANTTLFARWTSTASITYDGNGSTGGSAPSVGTYTVGGSAYTVVANTFTLVGHSFTGWNTSADGTGTAYAAGANLTPSSDLTLYAQWEVTATPSGGGSSGGGSSGGGASSLAPSPSSSIPAAPLPLTPIVVPTTISVVPGQSLTLVNGQVQSATVTQVGLTTNVSGPSWSMSVSGFTGNSAASGPSAVSGGQLGVSGSGYSPGSNVFIYVLGVSNPIGSAVVGADGTFAAQVGLPAGLVGPTVLQVNGYEPTLAVRSVSLGLQLTGKPKAATRIIMRSVHFARSSAALDDAARSLLRGMARTVGRAPAVVSTIGYTQGSGSDASSRTLSKERARVVNEYLKQRGVRGKFSASGRGDRGVRAADRTAAVTIRYSVTSG